MKPRDKRQTINTIHSRKNNYVNNLITFDNINDLIDFSKRHRILEPLIFLQYIEPKYLSEFGKGNLHFGSITKYINKENKDNDTNIGDNQEGKYIYEFFVCRNALLQKKTSDSHYVKKYVKVELNSKQKANYGIISFFAIFATDFVKDRNNNWQLKSNIKEKLLRLKNNTSRKLVIMNNPSEIIHELSNKGIVNRPIIYGDQSKLKLKPIKAYQKDERYILFFKRDQYSFQHEYRFIKDIQKSEIVHVRSIDGNAKLIDISVLMEFSIASIGKINLYLH